MKKGSHASPEERRRMKEAQLRARAARLPYVTPEQLEACRLDPAWEARQGMANCVVCRECGAKLQSPLGGAQGPSVETARDDSTGLPRCIPWRSSPSRSCTVISSSGENACGCYPFLSVEPRVGQAPARLRMQQANRRRFPGTWHPNLL